MQPEEPPNRPDTSRQLYPRRRVAADGFVSRPTYDDRVMPSRPNPTVTPPPPPPPPTESPEPFQQPQSPQPPRSYQPQTPEADTPPPQTPHNTIDFSPPPKPGKHKVSIRQRLTAGSSKTVISRPVKIFIAVTVTLMAILGIVQLRSGHTNSDDLLRQALDLAMSTKQLHADISSPEQQASIDFDYSSPSKPTISSTSTFKLAGLPTTVLGYGNPSDTYVNYKSLPKSEVSTLASTVKDRWVHLRSDGVAAYGVPFNLADSADPHYQSIGPILFGNVKPATKKQLLDYMFAHQVYDYSASKPSQAEINGHKTVVFTVTPNISYLKIANQSLASGAGLSATDIQQAIANLDQLKAAKVSIYIAKNSHRVVRLQISKNNLTTTTDYSHFDDLQIPAEPQTKLTWAVFASTQFQLSSQLAAKQPNSALDIQRKSQLNSLHTQLKLYAAQTGSYPSFSQLNDPAWLHVNLINLDPDILRDPLGTTQSVLAVPKAASLSYQPTTLTGKGICTNTPELTCSHYKLIATLSNNHQIIVQDP